MTFICVVMGMNGDPNLSENSGMDFRHCPCSRNYLVVDDNIPSS
jgi:hypothetical protein